MSDNFGRLTVSVVKISGMQPQPLIRINGELANERTRIILERDKQ